MPCLELFYRISKHVGEDINIVKPILMKKFPDRRICISHVGVPELEGRYCYNAIYVRVKNSIILEIHFTQRQV
jgi:hypothetical protein